QSAVRGYLLTNDTTFLESYYTGIDKVPLFIEEQHQLIDSTKTQRHILDSITLLHNQWLNYTSELINARRENPKIYQNLIDTKLRKHVGKNINDEITLKFKRFDKIEYK